MNHLKTFAAVSLAALIAYFEPVHSILAAIAWLLVLNFLLGLATGIVVHREAFQFRKALRCLSEASVFLLLLASVFFIGDHLGARGPVAAGHLHHRLRHDLFLCGEYLQESEAIIPPRGKAIAFLYHLVSVEILAKLPRWSDLLKPKSHDADPDR